MPELNSYVWDVFLSHSSLDKGIARILYRGLVERGLKVWFDEETIKLGDHIYSKIETGAENSRVLIFLASSNSLKSDWVTLERSSAVFRDPINNDRRMITIKTDDCELPDVLKPFSYLRWPSSHDEQSFAISRVFDEVTEIEGVSAQELSFRTVFTPGTPPIHPEMLVGRDKELKQVAGFLKSPGIHPIVLGERGIGKTSLVRACLRLSGAKKISILEANTVETFDEASRVICEDLGVDISGERSEISPARLLRILRSLKSLAVVSVDELDDLPKSSSIVASFAKFAKAASNQSEDLQVKFVFSGIGVDGDSLFGGHLSSSRNIPEVRLREIDDDDLRSFLDKACYTLKTEMPSHLKDRVVHEALGYPYYIHQVCYHIFDQNLEVGHSRLVTESNYEVGCQRALDAAFAHYLKRYKFTIYELPEIENSILAAFIEKNRARHKIDEIESEVSIKTNEPVSTVREGMRALYRKEYLRYRKGDQTISLFDTLLRPFLAKKLRVKLPIPTRPSIKKDKGDDQLEMF